MTSIHEIRRDAVDVLLADVQSILADQAPGRDSLASIRTMLIALAGRAELWDKADFPQSEGNVLHARYQVAQSDELTLYLNVMRPGNRTPPHNHTTWACIAGVAGEEQNYLYERIDDCETPGKAELKQTTRVPVAPGQGIALMPDDIHHVEVSGDQPIRHLHLYGRPLESLDQRLSFDVSAGTYKVMDIGVKSRIMPGTTQGQ